MGSRALKYVLSACILLCTNLGFAGPETKEAKTKYDTELASLLLPVEIPHILFWAKCGGWNGTYFRALKVILLCEENTGLGLRPSRFIYLHELGHGYTFQRTGFDFSRWAGNYEAAADEFAAVSSVAAGHPEDVLAMALLFEARAKTQNWNPKDPHPPAVVRAATLKRLYYGSLIPQGPLGKEWRDALHFWTQEFAWNN